MAETLKNVYSYLVSQITAIGVADVIDILVVAVGLYYLIRFIRQRRASKLAVGIVLLFVLYLLSQVFELNTINFIMDNLFQVGIIAAMIVFQPELRTLLESFGGQTKRFRDLAGRTVDENEGMIEQIAEAASALSRERTGALMVIQRTTPLGDYINSGTVINADVSAILLRNLFFNKSPLHDGAVIIRDGRIHAAGCFLPLSSDVDIMKELGTRHRAAIGASENSDAVIIVVSEENGIISVAREGELTRSFDKDGLVAYLSELLVTPAVKRSKSIFEMMKRTDADKNGGEDNE